MKAYKIYHWRPKNDKGLILLPVGVRYNIDLQKAKVGECIEFQEDPNKYMIKQKAYLDIHTQAANLLSMFLYRSPILAVLKRWQNTSVLDGNGKNAVSRNKCLLIHYNTLPEKEESVKEKTESDN